MKKKLLKIFSEISDESAEKIFSRTGEFGGARPEGLISRLYVKLKKDLKL